MQWERRVWGHSINTDRRGRGVCVLCIAYCLFFNTGRRWAWTRNNNNNKTSSFIKYGFNVCFLSANCGPRFCFGYLWHAEHGNIKQEAANGSVTSHQFMAKWLCKGMAEIIQERAEKETRPPVVGLRGSWTPRSHCGRRKHLYGMVEARVSRRRGWSLWEMQHRHCWAKDLQEQTLDLIVRRWLWLWRQWQGQKPNSRRCRQERK